ncbi:hypothetical protein J132_11087 [Termitomyces sp. J132]|nr:hypothetical protein J132_11087 [Termitomyces sp. J132]
MEASLRCNLVAAQTLMDSLRYNRWRRLPALQYQPTDMIDLIDAVVLAARRNISAKVPMTNALLHLLISAIETGKNDLEKYDLEKCEQGDDLDYHELINHAPLLALLMLPYWHLRFSSEEKEYVRAQTVNHVYQCLVDRIDERSSVYPESSDELHDIEYALEVLAPGLNAAFVSRYLRLRWMNTLSNPDKEAWPFLLVLIPVHLGAGLNSKQQNLSFNCFNTMLALSISSTWLSNMDAIRGLYVFVRFLKENSVRMFDTASPDLFRAINAILNLVFSNFLAPKNKSDELQTDFNSYSLLFDTCAILMELAFNGRYLPHSNSGPSIVTFDHEYPPAMNLGLVSEILSSVFDNIKEYDTSTKDKFRLSEEAKTLFSSVKQHRLIIEIFDTLRKIDPTFTFTSEVPV